MASQAIGIDIGSHAVKIAVLQKKGGISRATRLFRAPLLGDTDPVRVAGALKRAGVTGGPALIGISGRDLIIRYTHVPPVPDWRLKLLMQFEINEVSGQSGGEVAADYRRMQLPVEMDEDTVLVALARNTWLHPRLESARSAGLKAAGGCPNSVAVFNAFLAHGSWQEGETTFLVNIGRENIDMAIQQDGELIFARNMAGGGHMFTEAIMGTFGLKEPKAEKNKVNKGDLTPKAMARYPDSTTEKLANAMQGPAGQLVSMVQSSVMICRAQTKITDLNVDKLVLTGGTAAMRGIQEYFKANMNVPVEVFDPVTEIDVTGLDPGDAEELGDAAPDFAVAIGIAETLLNPSAFRLEVLTEKEKKKRHFAERTIWAVAAAAVALALVVMLFKTRSADIETVQKANEALEVVQQENKSIEERQNAALESEIDARKKDVAMRIRRLPGALTRNIFDVLVKNHAPPHIYLRRFEMEAGKQSFNLEAEPGKDRAVMGSEEAVKHNLHDQYVWPEIKVIGVMKRDTPSPGQKLNAYYTKVRAAVGGVSVEGWGVHMETTSLNANNEFNMTFKFKPKPKVEES